MFSPITRAVPFFVCVIPDILITFYSAFNFHKEPLQITNTMNNTLTTSAPIDDDHPLIPYSTFWQNHGSSYPFSSIYRTRQVMRIRWAIVSDSANIFNNDAYSLDLAILPYNSPYRDYINSKVYSRRGIPVPSELQDIVEFFVYSSEVPPECTRLFLNALLRTIRSRYHTLPEKVLHVKRYALYYVIPPMLMNVCSYEHVFHNRQDSRISHWWAYLVANPIPAKIPFRDIISPFLASAAPFFSNTST